MKKKKNPSSLIILLALVGTTVFFLLRNNDLRALYQIITEANPFYLAAGLLFMLLFVASEGMGIHVLLASLGYKSSPMKCLKYSFLGFYYCSITPSATGGQPAQVYYMKKDGVEVGDSSLCIMIITASYQIGMLLICLLSFLARQSFLMENLGVVKYFSLFGAAVNVIFLTIMVASAFHVDALKKFVFWIIRALSNRKILKHPEKAAAALSAQLEKYAQGAQVFLKKPGALLLTLVFVLIQVLSRLCVAIAVYQSFGLHGYGFLDILALEAFLALGVESLPLPGSVGAAEAGFVMVNKRIFGADRLVSAALLTRGISFYFFLIISGAVSIFVHITTPTRRRTEPKHKRGPGASES